MSKKVCIFILSLVIALAATVGVGVTHTAASEQSQATLCDQPAVRVSM